MEYYYHIFIDNKKEETSYCVILLLPNLFYDKDDAIHDAFLWFLPIFIVTLWSASSIHDAST
jgi:hypothetical protein